MRPYTLLVLSDSHGNIAAINQLLTDMDRYDKIVFLGDGWRDILSVRDAWPMQTEVVRGNCDSDCPWEGDNVFYAGGVRFFATHGDRYGVRGSRRMLAQAARAHDATVALYGHTHQALVETVDGVLCINPGHTCYPTATATYCVIEIVNSKILAKIEKYFFN